MGLIFPAEVTVRCEVTSLGRDGEAVPSPCCRGCGTELTVHQPDESAPEHLLGICSECGAWYLIEAAGNPEVFYLVDLPIVAFIQEWLTAASQACEGPPGEGSRLGRWGQGPSALTDG